MIIFAVLALIPLPEVIILLMRFIRNRETYRQYHWYILVAELVNIILLPLLFFMVIGLDGSSIFILYLLIAFTAAVYLFSRYHTRLKARWIYLLLNLFLGICIASYVLFASYFWDPKEVDTWFIIGNIFLTVLLLGMAILENFRLSRLGRKKSS